MNNKIHEIPLIILAGGLGTRLRSIVNDVPKPMALVNGEPFLCHLLRYFSSFGISDVTLATGHLSQVISSFFGDTFENLNIRYSEEALPLGTGGAIIKALQQIPRGNPAIICNGDTYFPVSLSKLSNFHFRKNASMTVAVFPSSSEGRYSKLTVATDHRITSYDGEQSTYRSGGLYMLSPKLIERLSTLKIQNHSFETELMPNLIKRRERLFAFPDHGTFIDIGIPSDYLRANQFIPNLVKPESFPTLGDKNE